MSDTDDPDDLTQHVGVAAHLTAIEQLNAGATHATVIDAAVRTAFACAIGNGLIQLVPRDQWPLGIAVHPPYDPLR